MTADKTTKDPGGQQPEMIKGLDAAARSGGMKPADQANTARPDTAPTPASLDDQEKRAAEILHGNAERDTGKPATK